MPTLLIHPTSIKPIIGIHPDDAEYFKAHPLAPYYVDADGYLRVIQDVSLHVVQVVPVKDTTNG